VEHPYKPQGASLGVSRGTTNIMQTTEQTIRNVVQEVLAQLSQKGVNGSKSAKEDFGVWNTVDEAVTAAQEAFLQFRQATMDTRKIIIDLVKTICTRDAE